MQLEGKKFQSIVIWENKNWHLMSRYEKRNKGN